MPENSDWISCSGCENSRSSGEKPNFDPKPQKTRNDSSYQFLHNNRDYDTAADIVKYRSISKSLVSKSVESLTRRGFLEAMQAVEDRRQVHLRIAPGAAAAVEQLVQIQRHFFAMLGEGLTEAEHSIFHQVLKKMGDNAERYSR